MVQQLPPSDPQLKENARNVAMYPKRKTVRVQYFASLCLLPLSHVIITFMKGLVPSRRFVTIFYMHFFSTLFIKISDIYHVVLIELIKHIF
jgi:hypothetical protein